MRTDLGEGSLVLDEKGRQGTDSEEGWGSDAQLSAFRCRRLLDLGVKIDDLVLSSRGRQSFGPGFHRGAVGFLRSSARREAS